MKVLLIILTAIALFSCNENYYNKEIIGNKMIITERFEDKIGTFVREYERIEVLNLRIDDDSEYHITYSLNGYVYSDEDLSSYEISVKNINGDSWITKDRHRKYIISYPSSNIEYFED